MFETLRLVCQYAIMLVTMTAWIVTDMQCQIPPEPERPVKAGNAMPPIHVN